MKVSYLVNMILFVLLQHTLLAQKVDYDQIIRSPTSDNIEEPFEEKLVRLAWNNFPNNRVFEDQITIAEKNLGMAKWSWTNNLRVYYNLDDRSFNEGTPATGSMSRFGLGLSINMGDFFTIPGRIGVAKGQLSITHHQLNEQKLSLRREMLSKYYNYQLALELLKIRVSQNEEAYSNYLITSEKFKNGDVTLEEYNVSLNAYNTARIEKLSQETQVKVLKLSIEELIGVPLEEVR